MPEASPQAVRSTPTAPDCLVLESAEVAEALAHTDLATALEHALVAEPGGDQRRRFRQLVTVDDGAFHVVGGAARLAGTELFGLKVNGRYEGGRMRGTMLLVDAGTGALTGLMDSGDLTIARTAAMVSIAVRHLAPSDLEHALVVGTGRLAAPVVRVLRALAPGTRIEIWGRDPHRARSVAEDLDPGVVAVADLSEAARRSQVIVTITSAEAPLLARDDVAPGALVVAVGSDAATKQELAPDLLAGSAVVVDSREQSRASGELRGAIAAGAMTTDADIRELADVIRDGSDPRSHPGQPVVVDLTGIALQDLVAARAVCAEAHERGLGRLVRLRV